MALAYESDIYWMFPMEIMQPANPPHPTPGQKNNNNVIVFKCFFLNASQAYIILCDNV